jgi:hypothetical protein
MRGTLMKMTVALGSIAGVLGSFSACSNNTSTTDIQIRPVQLFETLYLGLHGLNYPSSIKILQTCKSAKDVQCLRTYETVKKAAHDLKTIKSHKTLTTTLQAIRSSCGSDDEHAANFICYEALASLYFYNEPEFDAEILHFIENLPPTTQSDIINTGFAWFHNRPHPEQWLEYLKRAPVKWEYEGTKERVVSISKLTHRRLFGQWKNRKSSDARRVAS